MEAASREEAPHSSALHVPSAAPAHPLHGVVKLLAQDMDHRWPRGPRGHGSHVVLSLHASPCQLQHLGLGKARGWMQRSSELYESSPRLSVQQLNPRFLLPFPDLTQCLLLFLTFALGGKPEQAGERRGKIAYAKKYLHTDRGTHTDTQLQDLGSFRPGDSSWWVLLMGPSTFCFAVSCAMEGLPGTLFCHRSSGMGVKAETEL